MTLEEVGTKRVGTTIRDKWVVERLIGVGGMASVYIARHKIGRRDAIKILHPEIAREPELRARFEQEAHAVNALRHPGAVEIRDIDVTDDGAPFLVMELLEGESVADRARRAPPLTMEESLRIAIETLDVLDAAHAKGIIHRDVKPDNLFLTETGKVKVLDFGIARMRAGGSRAMATQAGMTLGTMSYMPPEQARGLEIDPRADIYAVGATLYGLLSGRIVHDAQTESELVMKAMSQPAVPLGQVAATVPPQVCAVVDRALAFDRAERYPDARTMKGDLEAVARGAPPPFASAASPLAAQSPSSEFFALRESFYGDLPAEGGADPGSIAVSSAKPSHAAAGSARGMPSALPASVPREQKPTRVEAGPNLRGANEVAAPSSVVVVSAPRSEPRMPQAQPSVSSQPAIATMLSPPTSGTQAPFIAAQAAGAPMPVSMPTSPSGEVSRANVGLVLFIAGGLLVLLLLGGVLAVVLVTRATTTEVVEHDSVGEGLGSPATPATSPPSNDPKGDDKDKKGKGEKKKGR